MDENNKRCKPANFVLALLIKPCVLNIPSCCVDTPQSHLSFLRKYMKYRQRKPVSLGLK